MIQGHLRELATLRRGRKAVAILPEVNPLIYAASPALHEADKQNAAQRLLEAGDLALSVQVL